MTLHVKGDRQQCRGHICSDRPWPGDYILPTVLDLAHSRLNVCKVKSNGNENTNAVNAGDDDDFDQVEEGGFIFCLQYSTNC